MWLSKNDEVVRPKGFLPVPHIVPRWKLGLKVPSQRQKVRETCLFPSKHVKEYVVN